MSDSKKKVTFSLQEENVKRLRHIASQSDLSQSALVDQAIGDFLDGLEEETEVDLDEVVEQSTRVAEAARRRLPQGSSVVRDALERSRQTNTDDED